MFGVRKALARTFASVKMHPVFSGSLARLNASVPNLGQAPDAKSTLAPTSAFHTPLLAGWWKVLLNASALPAGLGTDATIRIHLLGTSSPCSMSAWPASTSSSSLLLSPPSSFSFLLLLSPSLSSG